ncbi:MAG: ribosome maturation factor [Acidobacteriaceae bacterium]
MALQLDQLRNAAERVAASHHLDVVDVEFTGGAKFRTLRVFLEKNAAERAKLAEAAKAGVAMDLPSNIPAEMLSGVTHEDCAVFASDFGTLLDVEDLVLGSEYTLEVSSPGLDRKLYKVADYERFQGSLVKLQTFSPVNNNRHWNGRLVKFADGVLTLDLTAVKQKGKAKKAATAESVEIALANVEKAQLVPEI